MSTNTLIAFIVGLMFLLCVVVVLACFADRRNHRRHIRSNWQAGRPPEEDTLIQESWPKEGEK